MILTLPSEADDRSRWIPITTPQGQFEICIRPPTFDELIEDAERYRGALLARLEKHVVDWRGLESRVVDTTDPQNRIEKSEPMPFSVGTLKRICGAYPGVMTQVMSAVNRTFRGLDEGERKN